MHGAACHCEPSLGPPTEPAASAADLQAVEQLAVARVAGIAALLLQCDRASGAGLQRGWGRHCPPADHLQGSWQPLLTTTVSACALHDARMASPTEAAKPDIAEAACSPVLPGSYSLVSCMVWELLEGSGCTQECVGRPVWALQWRPARRLVWHLQSCAQVAASTAAVA